MKEKRSMQHVLPGMSRREFAVTALGATMTLVLPRRASAVEEKKTTTTRVFTDSLGRVVKLPSRITTVTPVGVHAQTLMTTLYPEGLVSMATDVSGDAGGTMLTRASRMSPPSLRQAASRLHPRTKSQQAA